MLYTVGVIELRFLRRVQWAADVWEYFWRPTALITYQAGQYANFYLADVDDPRGNSRVFTLTSLASDDFISFAVKITATPSPYKRRLASLTPGDTVYISEPMGDMILPRLSNTPLILVAGGLGITSYISLLLECDRSGLSHSIDLLWAVRTNDDHYEIPIATTNSTITYRQFIAPDRLTVDDILAVSQQHSLFYLSGSERFVMALRGDLHAHNIGDMQILFDYFSGYDEV